MKGPVPELQKRFYLSGAHGLAEPQHMVLWELRCRQSLGGSTCAENEEGEQVWGPGHGRVSSELCPLRPHRTTVLSSFFLSLLAGGNGLELCKCTHHLGFFLSFFYMPIAPGLPS